MDTANRSQLSLSTAFVRSLAVGLVYAIASALAAAILGPLSRLTPSLDNLAVWFIAGVLIALTLAPFISHSAWSRTRTILAAWAVLAFVRSLGLGIEAFLFKPTQMIAAILGAVLGILISLLVAWFCTLMFFPSISPSESAPATHWSWWGWTWRVLAVGLAYYVVYVVFGATNALLYTRSFYENNPQYGLTLPPPGMIFLALLVRGPLFGLGSVFIVRSVGGPRRGLSVWLGLLLFVVGGLAPYLETTFRTMPLGFNLATLAELFLQNFLTGIVAAGLFAPRAPASAAP